MEINLKRVWGDVFQGQQYVDLGLPSGTLWATMNIGAKTPNEFGPYFAWGEDNGYYGHNNKRLFIKEEYAYAQGFKDAASRMLGDGWRLPTNTQFQELIEECDYKFINQGMLFTSRVNRGELFFPACGLKKNGQMKGNNIKGYYWSRSLNDKTSDGGYLWFNDSNIGVLLDGNRPNGCTLRAVREMPYVPTLTEYHYSQMFKGLHKLDT